MHVRYDFALRKIISGGQTGADFAGLVAGRVFNLETGGFAPDDFKTLLGPAPDILGGKYGLIEGGPYPVRTEKNVKLADATIRFASNFKSPGERCTLRAINKHAKPYLDVHLPAEIPGTVDLVVDFIEKHAVQVLNVAGNADRKSFTGDHFVQTYNVLVLALMRLEKKGRLATKETECPTQ